jgi:hypothetical protein
LNFIKFILSSVILLLIAGGNYLFAQSVLHSGEWYKLAVQEDGVYKIDYNLLKKTSINPDHTDPKKIKIYGNGGGILPQANHVARAVDLVENAIYIEGEDDGKFDKNDFILFYAEGSDKTEFNVPRNIFSYQNNIYSDKNFYFLTVSDGDGKRIATSENLEGSHPVINTFDDYVCHEKDEFNKLHSGRQWFQSKIDGSNEVVLDFPGAGIVPGSDIKIVSSVMALTYTSASFKIFLNDILIAEQTMLPVANNRYAPKGYYKKDTITIGEAAVGASTKSRQVLKYQFIKGSGTVDGYLDFALLNFKKNLALYGNQTIFTSGASLANAQSTFEVTSATGQIMIWDVTNPTDAKSQSFSFSNTLAKFATETTTLKKFIVFNNSSAAPELIGKINNQNLHGLETPALLIVTHPLFKDEAMRLAEHRQNFNNLVTYVVTTDEVYHEFSSGRQDISAIRDFTKYLYDKNPGTLKALLLFGKSSYDYKNRIVNNTNFVPTYESRNSLHPLQTYSSDDYFVFLENNEGEWSEEQSQNHTLDIGVGRLPVKTAEEAKNVVDKLIQYDRDKKALGYWRKEIVFVADDGNNEDGFTSLHQYQANQLASYIETNHPEFDTKKIFMGTYPKTLKPNGEDVNKMTSDIVRAFDKGSLIINYTGHGSYRLWADEWVFTDLDIENLKNKLYPFLVTATCEFGQHDNPTEISSAEKCILVKDGGAIGIVSTGRPVNSTTNFNLNQAFYEALFTRDDGKYSSTGEVFKQTKNNSTSGVANRNFSLLGDPSMMLALPQQSIKINSLKTASGSDDLKALSTVIVSGEIQQNGERSTDFTGTLEATLFDKETNFTTTGRNDPPFNFKTWHNALFRGKASVTNGEFRIEFMLPKNIAYQVGNGKLGLYAADPAKHIDAKGGTNAFKVGETEKNVAAENTTPTLRLFMGDTTFTNGGVTSSDTYLIANLHDVSGINISSYGIGNSIIATLDNDVETFLLNDYYIANTDDFTSGWIHYPVKKLTPGRHTFTVKAWDVFNNPAEATVHFVVTEGNSLTLESFYNYPNPFLSETTLSFTHNRSGDDLEAELYLYTVAGSLIMAHHISVPASEYRVNLLNFDNSGGGDKKLSAGLYLARVIVRSVTNGSKNERLTKLIILN